MWGGLCRDSKASAFCGARKLARLRGFPAGERDVWVGWKRREQPETFYAYLVLTKYGYVRIGHQLPIKLVTNKSIPDLRRKAAPGLDGRKIDATTATYSTCMPT